ncbi:hypothetical protein ScPMuIL_002550 [Solemya velum]
MLKEILFLLPILLTTYASEIMPAFIQEPESAVIYHHASVTLPCKVTPSSAVVRWKYNDEYIETGDMEGVYLESSNLYIEKFKHGKNGAGHEGTYQCLAQTSVGTIASSPAVLSKPVLKRFPEHPDLHLNVVEGQHVILPCKPPESLPAALLHFMLNNSLITSSDHYTILPTGLLISGVNTEDEGHYRCMAVNPLTSHNRTANHMIHLHVWNSSTVPSQEVKIISVQTKVQTYSEESAFLECSVIGSPIPDVHWVKYGGSLPENRSSISHGNLLIKKVNHGDEGTYVCKASNGDGSIKENATILEIIEPPLITTESSEVSAKLGQLIRLRCSVHSKPPGAVTWYHNGEAITRAQVSNQDVSTYTIAEVEGSSGGLYQCMVINSEGTSHATIRLEVEGVASLDVTSTAMESKDENDIPINSPSSLLPIIDKGGNNRTQKGMNKENSGKRNTRPNRRGNQGKDKNKKGTNRRKKTGKKRKSRKKPQRRREGLVQKKLVPASKPDISQLSDTTVMLNWTVPQNDGLKITLFRVQYKEVAPTKGPWQTEERDLGKAARVYEVSGLKKGGTYKFRIAAIYDNNDNKIGKNSERFTLHVEPASHPEPPVGKPTIVEAIPMEYESVHAIRIHWQYIPDESSPIEGVLIFYKPYGSPEKFTKQRLYGPNLEKHVLQQLRSETEYSIKMQCFNSAGESGFSNTVVKRTLGGDARRPILIDDKPTRSPVKTTTDPPDLPSTKSLQSSSEMLYMILGIVLGIMMLLLIVFMFMCWWKQRQQRRMMDAMNDAVRGKFSDPSQRIYSDSMRKKYMNGGFALNGLNGTIVNGHIPHTYPKMNINVNPIPDTDTYSVPDSRQNQYQQSTFLPNGSVVGKRQSNNRSCDHLTGSHDQVHVTGDYAHRQSYEGSLPELCSGNHHKHKRRRRRPQSREQNTKDQATNTDLSSNEGTLEFSTLNGLSSSSQDSTGPVPQPVSPLQTFVPSDKQSKDLNLEPVVL